MKKETELKFNERFMHNNWFDISARHIKHWIDQNFIERGEVKNIIEKYWNDFGNCDACNNKEDVERLTGLHSKSCDFKTHILNNLTGTPLPNETEKGVKALKKIDKICGEDELLLHNSQPPQAIEQLDVNEYSGSYSIEEIKGKVRELIKAHNQTLLDRQEGK